ncbi:acetyl esterase/lipase [Microbacterium marinum]|uniref:Acetyl esterase/lipase n=1 Tax=Microbacterium marinum TaxID=421115 RepID=A0A7W7BP02_9MICO|nr:acetyl esterase/lipase [Microbacterium marinum]
MSALTVLAAVRSGVAGLPAFANIALAGTSSGGNIAVLAAQVDAAVRSTEPGLAALALVVPSLLLSEIPDAVRADAQSWQQRQAQLAGYLGTTIAPASPWASLAVAPVVAGVPPVFVAVAAHDEVAFGADRFCRAVRAGGGLAEHRTYAMTHVTATPHVEAAMIEDLAQFLAERLA